jgi:hypothetical protein
MFAVAFLVHLGATTHEFMEFASVRTLRRSGLLLCFVKTTAKTHPAFREGIR